MRCQYPMVGVVRKNIWAKKGCRITALDGGQVDIFYTPSTNTLYMVYRRIQQTNNKTHFCNWFLSNLLTPTALYSWGKFPNRSNQQVLTLKVLESHRSTLPSHNCFFVTTFLQLHCHTAAFWGSVALLISKCLGNHKEPS